ncbi:MAG TPA: winged helix-turn-helix transcriptional regulator [Candidatus Thermoplasmatota archaeon]|nr:winged helix-turn-helix transcriptional regulator [Candidatus Thermoplasmatota archaeon]
MRSKSIPRTFRGRLQRGFEGGSRPGGGEDLSSRSAVAILLLALLTIPATASAAPAEGAFLAEPRIPLWGSLSIDRGFGAVWHAADAEGTLRMTGDSLVVTVLTQRQDRSGNESEERESFAFTRASAVLLAGASGAIPFVLGAENVNGPWRFSVADDRDPPREVDGRAHGGPMPSAVLGGARARASVEAQPWMAGASWGDGAGSRWASYRMDAFPPFLPLVPFLESRVEGALSLYVSEAGVRVRGEEGERVFAAGSSEETVEEGGTDVPVVGRVGGTRRTVEVTRTVIVESREAVATLAAASETQPRTGVVAWAAPIDLSGTAWFGSARGTLRVDGTDRQLRGEDLTLSGAFGFLSAGDGRGEAWGGWPQSRESDAALPVSVQGDVTYVRLAGGPGQEYPPMALAAGAGAVGLAALLAGVPAAKFGLLKFAVVPLYTRLRRPDVVEHRHRERLLSEVRGDPGVDATELKRRTGLAWGTIVYHLSVLERERLVSSLREGRHRRFFPQGEIDHGLREPLAVLRNERASHVLSAIRGAPGLAQKDLSRATGLTPSTVHWHVERLLDAGLVWRRHEGRQVSYYPTDLLVQLDPPIDAKGATLAG